MPTRSSNTKVKRCPTPTTTDCVEWVAGDFSCLDICNGDILSDAQFNIATQICNLISATDLSSVTIPDYHCLKTAWATNDPTILNFIQFLLDKHCEQQAQIDGLGENELTLEKVFTVNYPDCCVSECQPSIELTIQQHFEKVLECLCQQYDRIVALEATVETLATQASVENIQDQIDCLKGAILSWNLNPNNTTNQINIANC